MNFYIQVQNGHPINHPTLVDNLYGAFGGIPDDWKPFIRVEHPVVGVYDVYMGATYEQVEGYYVEVHNVRPMTDEEKTTRIAEATTNLPGTNWTLNGETLGPVPPSMPTTGGPWKFDMETAKDWVIATEPPFPSWVLRKDGLVYVPPYMPTTGGPWKFDMVTAKDWVIATEAPFPSWTLREDGLRYVPPVPRPQDGNQYGWDEPTISWIQLNV